MLLKMPRCPLILISSPSGPCVMLTPGVSVSKSSNFRPSTGVVATEISSSVEEDSVLVTSTMGTSETTICCATAETFIVTGSVMVRPTVRFTFSCTMVAKPDLLMVKVYRPGARLRKAKCPSALVVSVCPKLVARFLASTVAPATLPPFSSRTSPWTVPAVICDWPHPGEASPNASATTKNAYNSFLIFLPQSSQPRISRAKESLEGLRWLARKNAAGEFMPGRYENTRRVPVETFFASNEVSNVIHQFRKMQEARWRDCGARCQLKSRH